MACTPRDCVRTILPMIAVPSPPAAQGKTQRNEGIAQREPAAESAQGSKRAKTSPAGIGESQNKTRRPASVHHCECMAARTIAYGVCPSTMKTLRSSHSIRIIPSVRTRHELELRHCIGRSQYLDLHLFEGNRIQATRISPSFDRPIPCDKCYAYRPIRRSKRHFGRGH